MAINRITAFEPVEVPNLPKYRSHLTAIPCDRMCPQDTLGGGSFTILFQNTSEGKTNQLPQTSYLQPVSPTSHARRLDLKPPPKRGKSNKMIHCFNPLLSTEDVTVNSQQSTVNSQQSTDEHPRSSAV
jgi:hypothetical protein